MMFGASRAQRRHIGPLRAAHPRRVAAVDTSQWHPDVVYDNHQVEPPRTPDEGYHLTEDLADRAIEFVADAKQIAPNKPPIHGVSFAHTFDDPAASTRHHTQYFEMFGHRAIDHDGWRAVCP
jgi:arylsulfatase A-like enzyme